MRYSKNQSYLTLAIIIVIIFLCSWPAYAGWSEPRLSPNGDTLYIGSKAIEKSNGHENFSTIGARLGTASPGTVTSTYWGPEIRLTNDSNSTSIAQGPVATVEGDTLVTVFSLNAPWGVAPYIMKSTDAGDNWTDPLCITNADTAQSAYNLFIHLYDGKLNTLGFSFNSQQHRNQNIYVKRSNDLGLNWNNPHFFFSFDQDFISRHTGAYSGDSTIAGFFHGSDHNQRLVDSIKVSCSFNNGQTWSTTTNAVYNQNDNYWFWLRYSLGRVHLVYQEFSWTSMNTEIFYARSDDWGQQWSDPIVVSDDSAAISQWPYLFATDDGRIIVSWFDYKYGSGGGGFTGDILYRLSPDNGESWGPEMRLTYDQSSTDSRSWIMGDHVGMLWEKSWMQPDIYYAESSDMGQTWTPEENLTNSTGASDLEDLIIWDNNLYLFWTDARDDPPWGDDIYFRKASVSTGIDEHSGAAVLPQEVGISAYPNPFNSSITISTNQDAPIAIYDITGRRITTLHAENGKVVWDASGYSSGVYFARVVGGEASKSIKLILLK
jgi:hypothetical protein